MSKRLAEWQQCPSIKRAKEIDESDPYSTLGEALDDNATPNETKNVLHWFRSKDLRIQDNKALHAASQKAEEADVPLITLYVHSPGHLQWHGTSPARTDLILRTIKQMQADLKKDGIPLYIMETEARSKLVPDVLKFISDNNISHVFANYEYEHDELMRDIKFARKLKDAKTSFEIMHDQCAVDPGTLSTNSGTPHKVFTPYHKAWLSEMSANGDSLLSLVPPPSPNSEEQHAKLEDMGLFKSAVPTIPEDKTFKSDEERDRIRKLWPSGYEEAHRRLIKFLDNKVKDYHVRRSEPSADATSRMSPYFSSGSISVRETLALCRQRNKNSLDFSGGKGKGISAWVREIVFREYYRQLTYVFPHKSMNMPQNLKMAAVDYVKGEEADDNYQKWCDGKTGFPLVDAGMRQLNNEAWMHNRARMNSASLLRTNMLIDYRRGERYFAEHLIDWDMSNNSQGWEPSYTVFNPTTQGENNDPTAEYIRKWCPELKDLDNKKIFAPYERCSRQEFESLDYPEPVVDWQQTKARAIDALKEATATGEH